MVPPKELSNRVLCHNEEYCQDEQLEENEMGVACGNHRKDERINISVGNPEGKRLLSLSRRQWQIIIKMILKQNGSLWTGLIYIVMWTNGRLL